MSSQRDTTLSGASASRRTFLKTAAMTALSTQFPFMTGSAVAGGGRALYESDFVPGGASMKLVFVADHHYWPNHFKNWGEKMVRNTEERMVDLIDTLNGEAPDISLHGGDVINAGGSYMPPPEEYIKQLEFEKRLLDGLKHPAIPIIGNHEVPDTDYESESELDQWRKRFGDLYGYRDIESWRLIWLNIMIPNPGGIYGSGLIYGIEDSQMAWLKKTLRDAESRNMHVLLFAHIPPRSYINSADFNALVSSFGCVRGMMVGHNHKNEQYMIGDVPVMIRVANVRSPMGYTVVYPYPDGRFIVVQKSQHFPFLDYVSNTVSSGSQGGENDRYFTRNGSSELSLDGLRVLDKYARAKIWDGHLSFLSSKKKGILLIDSPGLTNARISFSATKEGATHMGVVACASDDGSDRIEGVLTSEYGPDGNMHLVSHRGGERKTLARSWFNISDGIAYRFVLEVKNGTVTLANKNMPELTAKIPGGSSGKFGFFVDKGKMLVTDLKLEKLG